LLQRTRFIKHLTFGGAYSNHIAATAYAAHLFGLKSIELFVVKS
jgi:1-aminocyclopropane-1-carboxylate deaminase/D-cysteine desulfhydrase-like pyridoxal-dependent ACC family enzyme